MEINELVAQKVLATVDAGLSHGLGQAKPGNMCVEAAVCFALGLPHGDDPGCVSPALRGLKIRLNDSAWSSPKARAKGLRRLAVAQLGTKDTLAEKEFARRVALMTIKVFVPIALRAAASLAIEPHKTALETHALACETALDLDAARAAYAAADAAADAAAGAAAYAAAYAATGATAYAAAYAATGATADAAYAATGATAYAAAYAATGATAYAAAYAATGATADAAYAATGATAYAAAYAATGAAADAAYAATGAAADAAARAARDKILADFAEHVVQILVDMKAEGCQWLYLTEVA